jgi:hypothetical protein
MNPRATGSRLVQEQRVRRVARRRGYMVHKSRRRDPYALDYDSWQLIRTATGEVVASGSIDEVEQALNTYRPHK